MVAGELIISLALDENISHAPNQITTSAKKDADSFIINGEKTFVLDGHVADKFIVVASTAGETDNKQGISLFLVDANTAGVSITRTLMVDNRNSAKVKFEDVNVLSSALLGEVEKVQ